MSRHRNRPPSSFALILALVPSLTLPLTGCKKPEEPAARETRAAVTRDVHSHAIPEEARVTHLNLDLTVDFEERILTGTATYSILRTPEAERIILDARDLEIEGVRGSEGAPLSFEMQKGDRLLGDALSIHLPPKETQITVRYRTRPEAAALLWLTKEQAPGGTHPFLFTQGQAILTRTWIPIQDSPAIRMTYEARISARKDLQVLMSADSKPNTTTTFVMQDPIPAYLIALAVGKLDFRALSKRTGVYAHPSVVDAAAWEFQDVEKMVVAAEEMFGPYSWGRYDILILPPSFPFGGMENPRLTFASPTAIAGDRSLVSLIAHELSHSWSGNLVTNATWSDFWLNEGLTVYLEGRIGEKLYGKEWADMHAVLGRADLERELLEFGRNSNKTKLFRELAKTDDPDDGITSIPYEKGTLFFRMLEQAVGRDRIDLFLRSYFKNNAFSPMTSARFVDLVRRELLKGDEDLARSLKLEEWVFAPSLPDNAPVVSSKAFEAVDAARRAFLESPTTSVRVPTEKYGALEWVRFLSDLPRSMPQEKLRALDEFGALSSTKNTEIRFEWLRLVIHNRYAPAFSSLEAFLKNQGRRRFVLPLYEDLLKSDWGSDLGKAYYESARPSYHALTSASIDEAFSRAKAK